MTGDDAADADRDLERVPAALRDRIEELFVQYRGYEPATFQESLSLVADLAAAQVEAEGAAASDGERAGPASAEPGSDDALAAAGDREAGDAEPVTDLSAEVLDDASERTFSELQQDSDAAGSSADGSSGAAAESSTVGGSSAGDAHGDADGGVAADAGDDAFPETLRADPESNCALCGDVHPVSVLQTTIPDDADSIALVCPTCAD